MKTLVKNIESQEFSVADIEYEVEVVKKTSPVSISNKLPLLPLATYHRITSWLSDVSAEHNTEGVCSLTVVNGQWKVIVWHQDAPTSLHVDFDESSEQNMALIDDETRQALRYVHCTIHSHNKAPASQSNNDQKDERTKPGWHITVGNCDKNTLSTHARFNITRDAKYGDTGEFKGKKISDAHQEFIEVNLDHILEPIIEPQVNNAYLRSLNDIAKINIMYDYPEEWLDRITKPAPPQMNNFGMYNSSSYYHKKKTTTGRPKTFTSYTNPNSLNWQLCQSIFEVSEQHTKNLEESLGISHKNDKDMYMICKKARKQAIKKVSKAQNTSTKTLNLLIPTTQEIVEGLIDLFQENDEDDWFNNVITPHYDACEILKHFHGDLNRVPTT